MPPESAPTKALRLPILMTLLAANLFPATGYSQLRRIGVSARKIDQLRRERWRLQEQRKALAAEIDVRQVALERARLEAELKTAADNPDPAKVALLGRLREKENELSRRARALSDAATRAKTADPTDVRRLIDQMRQVCGLTDKQVRTLRVAAKGVEHRLRQAQKTKRVGLGFRAQPSDFHLGYGDDLERQLNSHPIWTRAVARVLSAEQRKRWLDHKLR